MDSSRFSSRAISVSVDAHPPQAKKVLFDFLHDMQLSGREFKTALKTYDQDPDRFVGLLKELRCNTPKDLPLWLLEFDRILNQDLQADLDIHLTNNNNSSQHPQGHPETKDLGDAYRATGKSFKSGSHHSRVCKKSSRCTLIWKGSSTCFASHFRKKHLRHYQNKDGTYNCCGIRFEGSTAEYDVLDHIWEADMEEVPLISAPRNKPAPSRPLRLPTMTASPVSPSASEALRIVYDPWMASHYGSANPPGFHTSGSSYVSNEVICSVATHHPPGITSYDDTINQYTDDYLPHNMDTIPDAFPDPQVMPDFPWTLMYPADSGSASPNSGRRKIQRRLD